MTNHMHQMGESGSFFDYWNPVLILIVVVLGILYFKMIGPWRSGFKNSEQVEKFRKVSLVVGLVLFYIAQGSPINYIGHHLMFSVHMFQQSMLYLIVPIFIIIGLPEWSLRPVLSIRWIRGIIWFFSRPLISVLFFNLAFSIYHFPMVMNYLMVNDLALFGYHAMLMFSAFMMWFPIFSTVPEYNRMGGPMKIGYIFLNGILLTPACALIIFADGLLYDMYQNVTFSFANYTLLDDQQLGGVIMKIMQEIVYGIVLYTIFRSWYKKERKQYAEELSDEPAEGVTFEPAFSYSTTGGKH